MKEHRYKFLVLNLLLVLIIVFLAFNRGPEFYLPQDKSSDDLPDLTKELDIRYSPEGPLYNDLMANVSKWTNEGADQKKIPAYIVKTNSFGARDEPFNVSEDKENIVFLGDSFTFGWGVNRSDRYSDVAEARLGDDKEFMNLAIPGSGIADFYLTLKHKGMELEPDKAIVGLRYWSVRSEKDSRRFREEARQKYPPGTEDRELKIQRYTARKVEALMEKDLENTALPDYIGKMSELSREEDFELFIYLIEDRIDKEKVQSLREITGEENVTLIEPPEKIVSKERSELILREGDGHYNQKAHRILGEHLASELEDY